MIFYVLAFAIAWSLWALAGIFATGASPSFVGQGIVLLGVFAPGIAALALAARTGGASAVRALVGQILRFEVPGRYYVFALGFMVAVKLAAAVLVRVTTGAWPEFGTEPVVLMIGALFVSTWVQAGEELGWRAFALPRLAARFGLGPASIVIGVVWAVWHLPLFYAPYSDTFGQSFPTYLLQVTALSVVLSWLYWRTQGSLFLVMLMHAAINNTSNIVPSRVPGATEVFGFDASRVAWTTAVILWVAALWFLRDMRGVREVASRTTPSRVGVS